MRRLLACLALAFGLALAGCQKESALDAALRKSLAYLAGQQSEDGGWRSKVTEPFKDGPSLTPVVLKAFVFAPPELAGPASIRERGQAYLTGLGPEQFEALPFPVYSLSMAVAVMPASDPRANLVKVIRTHQLVEELGWQPADLEYGGWGEGIEPYRKKDGKTDDPAASPNISNTLFALGGLHFAGAKSDDPAVVKAFEFVKHCQNADGGFFYSPTNLRQNKGGKDEQGQSLSYGSPTCDGIRALNLCGVSADDERMVKARKWLDGHFEVKSVPGMEGQSPVYFYYCWTLAHAWRLDPPAKARVQQLADHLVSLQNEDGSFTNPNPAMIEGDPLVATTLATAALALCRSML
ncbi:MAG: prenyltransferase/squalene oxidase repeat-containing protein [Vulcanimicrobiota bacterium]